MWDIFTNSLLDTTIQDSGMSKRSNEYYMFLYQLKEIKSKIKKELKLRKIDKRKI